MKDLNDKTIDALAKLDSSLAEILKNDEQRISLIDDMRSSAVVLHNEQIKSTALADAVSELQRQLKIDLTHLMEVEAILRGSGKFIKED